MKLEKCKCGAKARVRYKNPFTWVECEKKCGVRTGVYCDVIGDEDFISRRRAESDWNRLVKKNG